jgi:hypothetical protein
VGAAGCTFIGGISLGFDDLDDCFSIEKKINELT